jgi:DNA-binding GntR family transcriptional regulator
MTDEDIRVLRDLITSQEDAVKRENYNELAGLDMRFHEYICIKANHTRLLKIWYEQHAQCQMLLNLRFHKLSEYTPDTVIRDHIEILNAIERKDINAAISLTLQISERVAAECSQTIFNSIEAVP